MSFMEFKSFPPDLLGSYFIFFFFFFLVSLLIIHRKRLLPEVSEESKGVRHLNPTDFH